MKYKKGDMVKVIDNTSDASNDCIGEVGIITGNTSYYYKVKFNKDIGRSDKWDFYEGDLELVSRSSLKYVQKREITLYSMLDHGAQKTCKDFIAFAMKVGEAGYTWSDPIPLEKALEWRRTEFFFENGFIEKEDRLNYDLPIVAINMDGLPYVLVPQLKEGSYATVGYNWLNLEGGYGSCVTFRTKKDAILAWIKQNPHNATIEIKAI